MVAAPLPLDMSQTPDHRVSPRERRPPIRRPRHLVKVRCPSYPFDTESWSEPCLLAHLHRQQVGNESFECIEEAGLLRWCQPLEVAQEGCRRVLKDPVQRGSHASPQVSDQVVCHLRTPQGFAIWSLGVEVMVGLAWFVLALACFHTFAERGQANGSIVLSE